MNEQASVRKTFDRRVVRAALFLLVLLIGSSFGTPTFAQYKRTNLVSNQAGVTGVTDTNLVNAWGITRFVFSPFWVSGRRYTSVRIVS